jgi:hypothetical protein
VVSELIETKALPFALSHVAASTHIFSFRNTGTTSFGFPGAYSRFAFEHQGSTDDLSGISRWMDTFNTLPTSGCDAAWGDILVDSLGGNLHTAKQNTAFPHYDALYHMVSGIQV